MKKIFLYTLYLVPAFFFISCKRDKEVAPVDFGYNYSPSDVGHYIIYQVDSIWQDDKANVHDTTRYLLKEVIASTFLDNSSRPTMRIERYYKLYDKNVPYESMPWIGTKVWTANLQTTTLERKEENVTYLKLAFPIRKSKEWNGNAYNLLGEKIYRVISTDQPATINNSYFDSVLTVEEYSRIDAIEYIYEMEKYSRNIGLVYKERDSIYDGGTADTSGYRFTQKIIAYGK